MASLGDPARPSKAIQYFTPLVEDGFMYVGNQWQQYWKFDVRKKSPRWCGSSTPKFKAAGKKRPQRRAARQQYLFQHRQRHPDPAPDRARQEFRRGGLRCQHQHSGSRPNQGSSARAARGQEQDHRRNGGRNENGRGFVAAYAADTGKLLWKFLVVPDAGPARFRNLGRHADHSRTGGGGDLDRAVLRSGNQSRLFRHRQPRAHVRSAGPSRATISIPARSLRSMSIPGR